MKVSNLQKTMKTFILKDKDYALQMDACVLPWLKVRRQELIVSRKDCPKQKLYCACYSPNVSMAAKDFDGLSLDSTPGKCKFRGTVVLSHGYTENADKYFEIIYYFLKMGYYVYMPEHRGHGRSYRLVADNTLVHVDNYERYVDDLILIAHKAKNDHPKLPLYLYGHSMGGGIAAAAAAIEPHLFEKVILNAPMIQPQTHPLPWHLAVLLTRLVCRLGAGEHALPGSHPYKEELFEDSASSCEERFAYHRARKSREILFQTCNGSFQWTLSASKLHHFLMKKAWKQINIPLVLFQAEEDDYVSAKAQKKFVQKLAHRHQVPVWLIQVPNSKHEIFNSNAETLVKYWTKVFRFFK